ncbi:hypothetical protein BIW11_11979 [Tropilaelaps mercedesae]|uniref:Uncharacterized protein n=1 Tax=Tropilaelaps mercedesae TaxID=418985 RepID=A0A1V9X9A8_9ACAR|nr:hypothetical protein BIW11_11979 [Tropilaelaps mercedesae]
MQPTCIVRRSYTHRRTFDLLYRLMARAKNKVFALSNHPTIKYRKTSKTHEQASPILCIEPCCVSMHKPYSASAYIALPHFKKFYQCDTGINT